MKEVEPSMETINYIMVNVIFTINDINIIIVDVITIVIIINTVVVTFAAVFS